MRPDEKRPGLAVGRLAGTPGPAGNDRLDARRLGTLSLCGATHEVHVPPEPYRTLRSLTHYDHMLARALTRAKLQLKALLRRYGIPCRGKGVYGRTRRKDLPSGLPEACVRWQARSVYRQIDSLRLERVGAHRTVSRHARKVPIIKTLRTVPGLGPRTAPAEGRPDRGPRPLQEPVRSLVLRRARPEGRHLELEADEAGPRLEARESRDQAGAPAPGEAHNAFLRSRAVTQTRSRPSRPPVRWRLAQCGTPHGEGRTEGGRAASRRRYDARIAAGWDDRKAIRDVARTILFVACAVWRSGKEYDDTRIGTGRNDDTRQVLGAAFA